MSILRRPLRICTTDSCETLVLPEPLPLLVFLPAPFCLGITFIIDVYAFWVLEELIFFPEVFVEFW